VVVVYGGQRRRSSSVREEGDLVGLGDAVLNGG